MNPIDDNGHSGGCRCGAIRFEAADAPEYVGYCHCTDCRKATGAPVSAFVGFAADIVTFAGEKPRTFASGEATRSFCAICGSPISYFDRRIPGRVYFMLGAMDAPQNYRPGVHAFVSEKLPFVHMPDGLPTCETFSVERPITNAETD